jgi:hypothetical protein
MNADEACPGHPGDPSLPPLQGHKSLRFRLLCPPLLPLPGCDLIFKRQVKDEAHTLSYYEQRYFEDHSQDQTSGERTPVYRSILAVLGRYRTPGSSSTWAAVADIS